MIKDPSLLFVLQKELDIHRKGKKRLLSFLYWQLLLKSYSAGKPGNLPTFFIFSTV